MGVQKSECGVRVGCVVVLMMGRALLPLSVLRVLSCFTYLFSVERRRLLTESPFSLATQ